MTAWDDSWTGRAAGELKEIEWILKDVSFTIEPGSTVAIVGHTGAGKTTLTSLMMRFYDVTAGQILLDGVDVREHDLKELRQHFAVVLAGSVPVYRDHRREYPAGERGHYGRAD